MERRDSIYYWFVFLLNPFIAFVLSLKRIREPIAMNIFWGFCVFYGYTFAIGVESESSDIVRYVAEIKELYDQPMNWQLITNYFNIIGEIDFYRTFMAVFLSRFTENQRVITLFYAIVFGFFYSRNIWYVIGKLKAKFSFLSILLLIVLFLNLPIWYINGVRMWTAMQIFLYGLLPYIWDGNRKKLIFLFGSVLVHFSFYPMVLFIIFKILIGSRIHFFFFFFFFSLFISSINIQSFNNLFEAITPEAFQERTSSYRSEIIYESLEESNQNSSTNWYASGYLTVFKWCCFISIFVIYYKRKILFYTDKNLQSIFEYALFFFAIANLLITLPSAGRYLRIPLYLTSALVLYLINEQGTKNYFGSITKLIIPGYILFIVVAFRVGVYSLSTATIFANPLVMLFWQGSTPSINDFIK